MFASTEADEFGAVGCENIILFLTDGQITHGKGKDDA